MDEDACAGGCKGGTVEVEGAVDLGPSRELRVDARPAKKVEGLEGLGEKAVPKVEGKGGIGTAQACDEVVLERSDRTFGGVTAMNVGRSELEVDVVVDHEALEGGGCFVVQALEEGAKAARCQGFVGALESGEDFVAGLASHRLDMNVVAVVVVEDQHVGVAGAGRLDEAAGEIGKELAGGGGAVGEESVRADGLGRWGRAVVGVAGRGAR